MTAVSTLPGGGTCFVCGNLHQRWGIHLLACAEARHEQQGWRAASGWGNLLALPNCCPHVFQPVWTHGSGCTDEAQKARPATPNGRPTPGPRCAVRWGMHASPVLGDAPSTFLPSSQHSYPPLPATMNKFLALVLLGMLLVGSCRCASCRAHRVPCGAHRGNWGFVACFKHVYGSRWALAPCFCEARGPSTCPGFRSPPAGLHVLPHCVRMHRDAPKRVTFRGGADFRWDLGRLAQNNVLALFQCVSKAMRDAGERANAASGSCDGRGLLPASHLPPHMHACCLLPCPSLDACPRHFPQRRRPAVAVWQGQEVCQVPQVLDEAPDCRLWRVPVW